MAVTSSTSSPLASLARIAPFVWRLDRSFRPDMRVPVELFLSESLLAGIAGDLSLLQCINVATLPGIVRAALAMPDIHQGYGFPIGGVAAMDPDAGGVVSPGGVGFDINCGVRLLVGDVREQDVRPRLEELVVALAGRVPAGTAKRGPLSLAGPELDAVLRDGLRWALLHGYALPADLACCEEGGAMAGARPEAVSERARNRGHDQLGTLGSGNHFMELQVVEELLEPRLAAAFGLVPGRVTLMIHSGSRGLGHQVATDHIRLMGPVMRREGIELPDRQLAAAPIGSQEGQQYLAAMAAACNFAFANRQVLTHTARQVLGTFFPASSWPLLYDVAHNIAKFERHRTDGALKRLLVHRKGATRAFPPGHPDLPEAYRQTGQPVLIPGDMGRASYVLAGLPGALERSFGSVCHGAGRVMSRTAARSRRNFYEVMAALAARGVVPRAATRSGLTEEAPDAYKDIDEVVRVIEGAGLACRVARLRPLGVIKG